MSVSSKMTAIADKIRALLGISGTMGLDEMETNLATEQSNITAAYAAVSGKGGTVPSAKTSGNLASAISSISAGASVQRKSGNITFRNGQTTTVNCGFVPDMVLIKGQSGSWAGDNALFNAAFAFTEDSRTNSVPYHMVWAYTPNTDNASMYEIWCWQEDNGFAADLTLVNGVWSEVSYTSITLEYVAVKYT